VGQTSSVMNNRRIHYHWKHLKLIHTLQACTARRFSLQPKIALHYHQKL